MNMMTIEQKAKAHDEAIKRAKNLHKDAIDMEEDLLAKQCEIIFPELKESEDEEVRQAMINFFKSEREDGIAVLHFGVNIEKMIDWLEKQSKRDARYKYLEELLVADTIYQMAMNDAMVEEAKTKAVEAISNMEIFELLGLKKKGEQKEILCDKCKKAQPSHSCQDITELGRCAVEHEQKSADKIEPKFKVGDKVYNIKNGFKCTIESIDGTTYYCDTTNFDIKYQNNWELVEQKHEIEEINGEDYGIDGLWHAHNILEKIHDRSKEQFLSFQIQAYLNTASDELYAKGKSLYSEERLEEIHKCMLMWQTLHNAYFYQKPDWSEEDEKNFQGIIDEIQANKSSAPSYDIEVYDRYLSWLKSLRPQKQCGYNPYKAVVESISKMVEKYAPSFSNLQDFYDNVKVKCKDAIEYDMKYQQNQ